MKQRRKNKKTIVIENDYKILGGNNTNKGRSGSKNHDEEEEAVSEYDQVEESRKEDYEDEESRTHNHVNPDPEHNKLVEIIIKFYYSNLK